VNYRFTNSLLELLLEPKHIKFQWQLERGNLFGTSPATSTMARFCVDREASRAKHLLLNEPDAIKALPIIRAIRVAEPKNVVCGDGISRKICGGHDRPV